MSASAFDAETAVAAQGNGQYKARLSTAWDIGDNANGGYAMLPVLRALREESGHPDPLSITTHFLRPIQGGGEAAAVAREPWEEWSGSRCSEKHETPQGKPAVSKSPTRTIPFLT